MHVHELIGKQNVVFVAEHGFQFVSAGGGVDLIVDAGEGAGSDLGGIVAIEGIDGELPAGAQSW